MVIRDWTATYSHHQCLKDNSPVVTVDVPQLQLDLRSAQVVAVPEEEEGGHQGDDDPCEGHQGCAQDDRQLAVPATKALNRHVRHPVA